MSLCSIRNSCLLSTVMEVKQQLTSMCVAAAHFLRMDLSDHGVCMFTLWSSSTCTLDTCALFCRWPALWWKHELKINEYINALNSHTGKSQQRWCAQLQEVWNPLYLASHLILFEITSSSFFYLFSLWGNSILIYLLNINYVYTGLTLP